MEDLALSYNGVVKTYAIQAGRELRVVVGSEKVSDTEAEKISYEIAKKIQDEGKDLPRTGESHGNSRNTCYKLRKINKSPAKMAGLLSYRL